MKLVVLVTLGCWAAISIALLPRPEPAMAQTPSAQLTVTAAPADRASATGTIAMPRFRPLVIPVVGVTPSQLLDNFAELRGDAPHEAIDIPAARGTAVIAVDDGTIAKLFNSEAGGLTVYQFDPGREVAYFYGHLDGYAPGLAEGMAVKCGDLIGYVGSTGNANPEAPHLHFAIFVLGPEKRWWEGTAVNPYPLLSRTLQP